MLRFILLLSILMGCASCGLKGPLYLPESTAPVIITPSPSTGEAASSAASSSSASSSTPATP